MESCGSDVEGGAITVSGQACVDDGSRRLSDMPEGSFRLFMRRLGVLPQAWSGWATVYSHPHQVFLFSGCASFVGLSVSIVLALASKPFRWDHHGLCILNCTGHVVWFMMIWRLGPSAAKLYSYYAIVSLSVLASTVYSLRLMLGPLQYVPFRNLLAFVSLYAVELWLAMVPSQLGWWEPDLPSQPYKSFTEPIFAASVRSLKFIDAITDMLVIQAMLQKAHTPCFWFGVERDCVRWIALAVFAGFCAAVDLVTSLYLIMGGDAVADDASQAKRRIKRLAHVVSFCCEIGIGSATLFKLFSEFQEPAASMSPHERRNAVSLLLVSFTFTLTTFCMTMVGVKKFLGAAARVGVEVRSRISRTSVASRRPSRTTNA